MNLSAAVFLRAAALFFFHTMSFTYHDCNGTQNQIDYIRLIVADTTEFNDQGQRVYAFSDNEIMAAYAIEQNVWMAPQFYSGPIGLATEANPPVSYYRVAARLIDSLASNQSRIAMITQILDVKLNAGAAKEMRAQAAALRETEDNNGSFVLIEQVSNEWSFVDRYWRTIMRENASF